VATATGAIAAALQALGARRICLFSPYPAWLNEEAAAYWTAAGYEVTQVVKISDTYDAYALTTADVVSGLRDVQRDAADAIVLSGTGMLTLPAILDSRATPLPLLSANLCCAWWLTRQAGAAVSPLLATLVPGLT